MFKNEVIDSIYYDVKRHPIGYLVGGIGGYFIAKKLLKKDKIYPIAIIPMVILGAITGMLIENVITKDDTLKNIKQ